MARLPRFRKIGVQQAPAPQFDYANLREGARIGTAIQQQVDRMSDFLYKKEAAAAERRGIQMAADQGAIPTLQQLSAAGGPSNIEERAAFDTANRIASAEVETSARQEINRIISEAELNKTPYNDITLPDGSIRPGVQSQLNDVVDGFPAALSDLDPATAGILRAKLGGLASDAELRYSSFWNKLQVQQAQGRALETLAVDTQDIRMYAASEISTPDGLENKIGDLAQKMRDLQFDEDKISEVIVKVRADAVKDGTIAEFQRLGTIEEKTAYLEDLEKKPLKQLGVSGTRTLIRSLQAELNTSITTNTSAATDLMSDIKGLNKILTNGGNPSEESIFQLETKANSLGDYGLEAQQALADFRLKREIILSFRKMSPGQLQNEINAMANGLPDLGEEGLDTQLETDIMKSAEGLLETITTQSKSDPISLGYKMGHIDFQPLDLTSPEAAAASINERRDQGKRVAAIYGVEPKYLTNEEATLFSNMLKTGDRLQRMEILGQLSMNFKSDAPDVLSQIAPKQPELAHIGGLVNLGLMDTANSALEGMDMIADGNFAPDFTKLTTQQDFVTTLGPSLAYQPNARGAAFEVAKAIYTQIAVDRGLDTFDPSTWQTSINLAMGYNPNTGKGGIVEVRDFPVLAPSQLDGDQLDAMLDEFTYDSLTENTGQNIDPSLAQDIANNSDYKLMIVSEGNYYIVSGTPGESDFRILTDLDDQPIVIDPLKFYGIRE